VKRVAPSSFSQNRTLAFGALLAALLILPVSPLPAQQFGGIRGQVVDSDFGQPIAKASVVIMDTPFGAMTDEQGNYTISGVPAGIYTLQVRGPGYLPRLIPEVTLSAGVFNDLRVEVIAEIEEMEELVVPGELDKASEVGLLTERQEATAVMDMIGQDFIARLGASTAGDALKRVTGTSVVDGKYVSVRGLSDRYVNTLLNGGRLPSTDPDKRAVNVDLFPGASLESINVIKTFTPDQPGDFTGGSVDLRTRNFPDKPSFGASATVEYNSQTTFNPNFLSYQGGGTGPFGFQADKRKIPSSVTSQPPGTFGDPTALVFPAGLEEADRENTLMRDMNPVLSLRPKTVGPNYKVNLQGGDVVDFGDEQKMGVFGLFSYNREYAYYGNGTRTQLYRQPFVVNTVYSQQRGTEDVLWGTLLNLSGQLDANHKISSNFIFNEQASDNATATQMSTPPTASPNRTSTTVIDYGERQLAFMQLTGESVFPEAAHLKMNWNGGLGQAQLTEPDQRAFQAVTLPDGTQRSLDPQEAQRGYAYFGELSPAFRYQRELTENSFYTIADFLVPMDGENQYDNTFKTGFYYDQSDRSYNQDSYTYEYGGSNDPDFLTSQPNIPGQTWSDYFLSPDRSGLVNPTGQGNGQLMSWTLLDGGSDTGTFYDAYQAITASYLMANFKLFPQLKLTGGTRFENTNIQIKGADNLPGSLFPGFTGLSKIQQLDLLPAVGATFELAKDVNLRFSWSQTLARPSFKEMGPVLTQDFGDSTYFVGNPFLQLSSINNYDFRAEWFPRAGEVISVGLFFKEIDAPIEQITFGEANTGTFLKYVNSDLGQIWGWEVEFRKRLDQMHAVLKDFSVFFNFTQIQSQVTLSEQQIEVRNDSGIPGDTRPLQGQPAYVLNTGLNYDNAEYKFYAGVYFNVSGEFLYAAGGGNVPGEALPDVYEQPFPSLDFNLTQGLTDNWKMTFRGKNMLNPFYRLTQTLNGTEYDTYTYTKGWDLSLNVSYSF
jgi:TonB-dependent receptor